MIKRDFVKFLKNDSLVKDKIVLKVQKYEINRIFNNLSNILLESKNEFGSF